MKSRALVLAVLALGMLCPASVRAQSLADAVARVERLIAEKHPQEALDLAKRLVTENPASDQAWWAQARARRELGDARGALDDYSKAIEINPVNVRAYTGRATALDTLGRREEALRDVNRSISINPRYPNAYESRAMLKARAGDTKGALEDCDRAIAADPKYASALARRAEINSRLGNFDAVIRDATAALSLSPDLATAIEQRAYAFLQLKRYRESIADYTRSIELGHHVAASYNDRAYCHRMLGELPEALADARKSVEFVPDDPAATRNLREIQALLPAAAAAPASARPAAQPGGTGQPAATAQDNSAPSPRPTAPVQPQQQNLRASVPAPQFKASDPCSPDNKSTAATPWQKVSVSMNGATTPPTAGVTLSAAMDVGTLSRAQYAGAVSAAYEGMRLLYGPMSEEDTKRFEKIWGPLFDYPSHEIVQYLGELNPLLAQFLSGREAMMRAAAAYEAAVLDASLAVAAKERSGWDDAMASATQQASVMRSLQGGLIDLAHRIEVLGNPPNPLEAKCNARHRHQEAVDTLDTLAEAAPTEKVFASNGVTISTGKSAITGFDVHPVSITWSGRSFSAEIRVGAFHYVDPRDGTVRGSEGTVNYWARGTVSADGKRVEQLEYGSNQKPYDFRMSLKDVPFDEKGYSSKLKPLEFLGQDQFPYRVEFPKGFGPPEVIASEEFISKWLHGSLFGGPDYIVITFARIPTALAAGQGAPSGASGTSATEKAKADAAEKAAAEQELRETVEFHKANVTALTRTLQSERDELARETNDKRRGALSFLVIQLQSDIQGEQDLIASYQTGTSVHTRSVFDEFAHQQFIQGIQKDAVRVDGTRRIAAAVDRQVELLPEEQRAAMRKKVRNLLDGKTLASGDVEKARRVADAINNEVQGYWQGQAAMEEEKALAAQEHEFYVQTAVMAIGGVTVGVGSAAFAETFGETAALTVWGPHLIGGVYGGVTGTVAGGPVEGLTQTVAWSSTLGYTATQFLEGYQAAASNPKTGGLDRLWEGAKQAGTAYVMGEAFNFGAGLVNKGALTFFGKDSQLFKPVFSGTPTVRQVFDAERTQQQVNDAKSLIARYQNEELQMATLRTKAPANAPEAQQLDRDLQSLAASINSAYHTKWLMKYEAHPLVRTKFNTRVEKSYGDMMPEIVQVLKGQKYDMAGVEFQPMRNASSAGSSSMDLDLALKERPGMVFMKDGKQVSLQEFMTDAQRALNGAYHHVTGFSAERSELLLTTSLHPEAFTDARLLKRNVDFESISPQDIANIGSVLQVKIARIEGDPLLSNISKAQASCRESTKEIENMLLPALRQRLAKAPNAAEAAKLQASLDHWNSIHQTFKQIGTQETNPYEILKLERTLREQTGGLGIQEAVGELSRKFEKLGTSTIGK